MSVALLHLYLCGKTVTGLSFEEDKQRSVQAKADAFYTKPLSMRVFSDLIAYVRSLCLLLLS